MKAIQIFLHSLRQVTGNLSDAIRVSAAPYALQFVVSLLLLGTAAATGQADPMEMAKNGGGMVFLLAALLNLVVVLITSIWAAVAWHRFVLKGEAPTGFIPPFRGDRNWAYFARSFGIGILCVVLAIPLGFIGAMVAMPFFNETGPGVLGLAIVFLVTYLPLTVISYRLSTALPATALDAPSAFTAGWEATKGESATFIVLALISVVAVFAISTIGAKLFGGIMVLALIWQLLFGWFTIMVGLSILTTLYGHYIEKRPLV